MDTSDRETSIRACCTFLSLAWSLRRLVMDMERARREGWFFGAKLVRGAYMVSAGCRCSFEFVL